MIVVAGLRVILSTLWKHVASDQRFRLIALISPFDAMPNANLLFSAAAASGGSW